MKARDIIFLTFLFLVVFYVRTVPYQDSQLPIGEGDAAHQLGRALNMMDTNSAPRELPFWLAAWYHYDRINFYSPYNGAPFFINTAMMGLFTGNHLMGANLWLGLSSVLFISLSLFLLVRKLYGFWPAALASLLIVFDRRLVWSYIWGQRTVLMAFAMIPVVVYCYYRYTKSVQSDKEKPIYFFLAAAFMAFTGFFHPYVGLFSITLVASFTILLWVKHKKIPINWKTMLFGILIYAVIFLPFLPDFAAHTGSTNDGKQFFQVQKVSTLFRWFEYPTEPVPNPHMYNFSWVNGGYWLLPLILIGIIFLLMRRKDSDLFMLTWLVLMYIFLHLNVLSLDIYRIDRLVKGTSLIFYPLAAIGLFAIPKLIKIPKRLKPRYVLIAVFLVLMFIFNVQPVYDDLKNKAYPGEFSRMNPAQQEAAKWIDANLDEHAIILSGGSMSYPKLRWMHILGKRATLAGKPGGGYYTLEAADEQVNYFPITNKITHLLFDYSDFAALANSGYDVKANLEAIAEVENEYATDAELIYDQNGIRIFDLRSDEIGGSPNEP